MIVTLLAALSGAAQPGYVVYEGVQSSYFVEDHPGSDYSWRVLIDFSPDTDAGNGTYQFESSNGTHQIQVRWNTPGIFYLDVTETDITGCTNRKVLAVNVLSNNRSIAFNSIVSSDCYTASGNGFGLPLRILDDGGIPLDAAEFPVNVEFTLNGISYNQPIYYDQQALNIDASWLNTDSQQETVITVQLNSASDKQGVEIPLASGGDVHTQTINPTPQLQFVNQINLVTQLETEIHEVEMTVGETSGATYHWRVEPANGTSTDLQSITDSFAEIYWDGPEGFYTLYASASDGNGCLTDTVQMTVEVAKPDPAPLQVYAGPDTTIASCQLYKFTDTYPDDQNYTYLWEPASGLDDPTIPNPTFTPGNTTEFVLTVTTLTGYKYRDTVLITVAELLANAGDDVMMDAGNSIVLNGSASQGRNLSFAWTTSKGKIEEGENTAYPVISQPGTYYLEVSDEFGCTDTDSVKVSLFANAPIARDDYDTTAFQTAVLIDVLVNDYDADGNLDPATLTITNNPVNGVVDIDYFENKITYTPNQNFTGTDLFEYQVCDLSQMCDNATVYVLVTPINFLIPQAFTPNGDNINDFFQILGIEYYPNNSLTVINRWGKKVYEAKAYGIETTPKFWDGKSNVGSSNGDLPTGTYFYILELGNGEKPIAGSVYIDR